MKNADKRIDIIGGGLAGSEAALQLAKHGYMVRLYDMKPLKRSPAHHSMQLAEIVCSNSFGSMNLDQDATASGLPEVADLVSSASSNLERPEDDDIDATPANGSSGARYIVERSESIFAETSKPVVIAAGGRLTDVADAYLLDPSVVERVVVVASAGSNFDEADSSADVGRPNGEMDPWASEIVIQRFTYVQVGAHYDQTTDVPESRLDELPDPRSRAVDAVDRRASGDSQDVCDLVHAQVFPVVELERDLIIERKPPQRRRPSSDFAWPFGCGSVRPRSRVRGRSDIVRLRARFHGSGGHRRRSEHSADRR